MMNPYTPERRPWLAGICTDLADEFGLPIGVVRAVMLVFAVLPTGLAYLALAWLAGQRQVTARSAGRSGTPIGRDYLALRQRFGALEPRLGAIEAFVSSKDFELHKGFRQMRG